ncbi:MAG: L-serine ammonia-lyase, iron-sulfur-dependent, subunit alpha [Eubacteriales bacterium]|nr:L-serine ammonia-lyase, iron-sulfur-dependent, subunit alpha [Eubacteriales bacterium]
MRPTRFDQIVETCEAERKTLDAFALEYEIERAGKSEDEILRLMQYQLDVMKAAAEHGLYADNEMLYGLTSGCDGKKLLQKYEEGKTIAGGLVPYATAIALGIMEYNASMGRIVAAPTAGSAGIVPGCLLSAQEQYAFSDEKVIRALLVSALVGVVMAHREVSFSGSVGGCQGEVGVSSAMAAAGLAALFTDDPKAPFAAMAICMKNLLGLVCDPIAGPIEVPCIKRNAVGVANAFISAEMALAGIESYIPPDQVVDALIDVERRLPGALRCTTTGGLACTQKAVCLRAKLAEQSAT